MPDIRLKLPFCLSLAAVQAIAHMPPQKLDFIVFELRGLKMTEQDFASPEILILAEECSWHLLTPDFAATISGYG